MRRKYASFALVLVPLFQLSLASASSAPDLETTVADLGHAWAKANYATPDAAKDAAFLAVADKGRAATEAFPGRAEPRIWEAIALASAAKAEGGLGALHKAREARDLLLEAQSIDADALDGSVYTSLGSLYAKVPSWPVGFGDVKKARSYLEKALAVYPRGIDAHYFYADFLADQGDYAGAAEHLRQALQAPARSGREDADAGRREDAGQLLRRLEHEHADALTLR